MIEQVGKWFDDVGQQYVEEADFGGGNKTFLTIFDTGEKKVPASVYVAGVAGLNILTVDTQELLPDVDWDEISVHARSKALEWMGKDNGRNSLGNWGICPFGRVRFQIEIPLLRKEDVVGYMDVLKRILSELGVEVGTVMKILEGFEEE